MGLLHFYRAMHYSAKRGLAIACGLKKWHDGAQKRQSLKRVKIEEKLL